MNGQIKVRQFMTLADRIAEYDRRLACRGSLSHPTTTGYARNPLCGDEVWIDLVMASDTVQQIRFRGRGCLVSQACASMLCEGAEGKAIGYLRTATPENLMAFELRDLTMNRQRCALVAFEALCRALDGVTVTPCKDSDAVDIS